MLNLMQAHSYPLLKWYKAGRPAGIYRQGIEKKRTFLSVFQKKFGPRHGKYDVENDRRKQN